MDTTPSEDVDAARAALRKRAQGLVEKLYSRPDATVITDAVAMLDVLRGEREFELLGTLAEAVSRHRREPYVRGLLAQSLVDRGMATIAADVLNAALADLGASLTKLAAEHDELTGLLGRANKQIFLDAVDPSSAGATDALQCSVEAYRAAYERKPENYWQGVNLCAVLYAARKRGIRTFPELNVSTIARAVQRTLQEQPRAVQASDPWWSASLAETHVALGDWDDALERIGVYVTHKDVTPFHLAGTLRQFRDVWEVQKDSEIGRGIVQLLEAKLLTAGSSLESRPYPSLALTPSHIRETLQNELPPGLEAKLGDISGVSIPWYRTGLERATSVAAVRFNSGMNAGARVGTGFAVRAGDFGINPAETVLLLTNYHVVNTKGFNGAPPPSGVDVIFEVPASAEAHPAGIAVRALLAESPVSDGLDYALLFLDGIPADIKPLPLATDLPPLAASSLVYVIGYPGGKEMRIALQDNALLDHEGPPSGTPPVPTRCRVHYHAPTEPGSSGSPVFNDNWQAIALHHAGRRYDPPKEPGMPKLNGIPGFYAANEGYWIRSVIADISARKIVLPNA